MRKIKDKIKKEFRKEQALIRKQNKQKKEEQYKNVKLKAYKRKKLYILKDFGIRLNDDEYNHLMFDLNTEIQIDNYIHSVYMKFFDKLEEEERNKKIKPKNVMKIN